MTHHFEGEQFPNKKMKTASFKGNLLVHVKPFPKIEISELSLQKNQIMRIDPGAFKEIINLAVLDLSHNQLTTENLKPNVFEVIFMC